MNIIAVTVARVHTHRCNLINEKIINKKIVIKPIII